MSSLLPRRFPLLVLAMGALLALSGCPAKQAAAPAPAEGEVRARMEAFVSALDVPAQKSRVSWEEHVVLAYRLAQHRDPTPLEFHTLEASRAHHGLGRGEALALIMRGEAPRLGLEQCEAFLDNNAPSDFVVTGEVRRVARELAGTPPDEILHAAEAKDARRLSTPPEAQLPGMAKQNVAYHTYFGFLHAHSHLSLDARGDPEEAYRYARDVAGLDFFALTDHSEFFSIWPWDHKWEQLRNAADGADRPGSFTALWGFEWSNPILGHINVINSQDFTDSIATYALDDLYTWIAARPEAFARFNHPGDFDYLGLEFHHFEAAPGVIPQMTGIETWNGSKGFDRYFYGGSYDGPESYLDDANLKGWRLGALGAEDNHREAWGTRTPFRTGVLAEELTRDAILDAYRARRFYATEDKDLELDFRCQGYPMGARLTNEARVFRVTARDGSGDDFERVRLFRDGEMIASVPVEGSEPSVTIEDPGRTGADYYYVIVTQTGDNDQNGRNDEAISSPIWFGEIPPAPPGCAAGLSDSGESAPAQAFPLVLALMTLAGAGAARKFRQAK